MEPLTTRPSTTQRAELTFKQNVAHGRHGWLRLTPAYSVGLVNQVLDEFGGGARRVFEPFSGTGTTPLCAGYRGLSAVATDINPFLIWLGKVKSATYAPSDKSALLSTAQRLARRLRGDRARRTEIPSLKNIERWWHPAQLAFVTGLRGEVAALPDGPVRDLLDVAFCRTLIALSNAAFNHQSMSFKSADDGAQVAPDSERLRATFVEQFLGDVATVSQSVTDNPSGTVRILRRDARAGASGRKGSFDLLITSPPYPNRMSYIRELRPYMYWLSFLGHSREAGQLDWDAIGGTWGSATSRLATWSPSGAYVPRYLSPILRDIRGGNSKYGELMARYVHKYFDDMFRHFEAAVDVVRPGGTAHYIVGNSAFYGHVVPVERIYADQLSKAGFGRTSVRTLRKRNSKKELFEFHVIAER